MSELSSTSPTPQQLIDSFCRVTEKIDSTDYADITDFWIDRHREKGSKGMAPIIRLNTDHLEELGAHGRCAEEDPVIMIHPRVLKWKTIGIDSLLAHEFAHILHIFNKTVKANEDEEERAVAQTMKKWGYEEKMITICNEQSKNFPNDTLEQVRERIRLYHLESKSHD